MSDDPYNHYLALVGDVCQAANLGGLEVDIRTQDGESIIGVPAATPALGPDEEIDATGYAETLFVGDRVVALDAVAAVTVFSPR